MRDLELEELRGMLTEFREETRQRLDLLEHDLNRHLSLLYLRIVVDYMARAGEEFARSLSCSQDREKELECKEFMLRHHQKYVDVVMDGDLKNSIQAVEEAIAAMEDEERKEVGRGSDYCALCCRRFIQFLTVNRTMLEELNALQTPATLTDRLERVQELNLSRLEEGVLKSLSHEARLAIILSIFNGGNRFANLIKATGLRGGHLLYHVNNLVENGFIRQYPSKDYGLTKKGIRTLSLLTQLQREL